MTDKLTARERIILAVDTSSKEEAEKLAAVAKKSGARFIKMGLELSSAQSWRYCSELARQHGLDWVADAKLDDIPNTIVRTVRNICNLEHPPFGITMHATSGVEAIKAAQKEADSIKMLCVTVLTSLSDEESERIYRTPARKKVMELASDAASAGALGVVASPLEVDTIKQSAETQNLFAMIPGTRSAGADDVDQARVTTAAAAIRDGADLLVIGRQITQAPDPAQAFEEVVAEIEEAAK